MGFFATTSRSAPGRRIGTLALAGASCLRFSLRIDSQVPTFHTAASIPAHAASMPATIWAEHRCPPDFVPGQRHRPGFDGFIYTISTPHQRFTCVRLLGRHLTSFRLAFSADAHHTSCYPRAAPGGLRTGPVTRPRGASPHRLCSTLHQGHDLSADSWRTVIVVPCPVRGSGDQHARQGSTQIVLLHNGSSGNALQKGC